MAIRKKIASIRDQAKMLGYSSQNRSAADYFGKLTRHTLGFRAYCDDYDQYDLWSKTSQDAIALSKIFLGAICKCKETSTSHCNGQKHGEVLFSAMGTQELKYPRDIEKILHPLRLIFVQQRNNHCTNHNDEADRDSDEELESSAPKRTPASTVVFHNPPASEYLEEERRRELRSQEQGTIDSYLNYIYPPVGERDFIKVTPQYVAVNSRAEDDLLIPIENIGWVKISSRFIERYLHDHKLYFLDKKTEFTRVLGLVEKVKEGLSFIYECLPVLPVELITIKCEELAIARTHELIERKFVQKAGLQIRQSYDFLTKLRFYREKWEREQTSSALEALDPGGNGNEPPDSARGSNSKQQVDARTHRRHDSSTSLQNNPTSSKRQKIGRSSEFRGQRLEHSQYYDSSLGMDFDYQLRQSDDSQSDSQSNVEHNFLRATLNNLPSISTSHSTTPPRTNTSPQIPQQGESSIRKQYDFGRWYEPSLSPGTAMPASPTESNESETDINPLSQMPGSSNIMRTIGQPVSGWNNAEAAPNISSTKEALASPLVENPIPSTIPREPVSRNTIETEARPKSIAKQPQSKPIHSISASRPRPEVRIEIELRLWRERRSLWSNPYSEALLKCSFAEFISLYAEKSQIPLAEFQQLELSFPGALARTLDKNDDEWAWKSLKDQIKRMFVEMRREIAGGRRRDKTVFLVRVEAKDWDWGAEARFENEDEDEELDIF